MLRIHFMQQWFGLSDPAMEEALHDVPPYRQFAGLDAGITRLSDETTILRFRHLLERHHLAGPMLASINELLRSKGSMLRAGTVVDATLIAAPGSTRNADGERDPEMHQTKKGNQWHFGMKAHTGADAESGLVHTVIGTAADVNDVTQGNALLHVKRPMGSAARATKGSTSDPRLAMSSGTSLCVPASGVLDRTRTRTSNAILDEIERIKASIRAEVEYPLRDIQRQFGFTKFRYRGLAKNTAQLTTLFALSNLWMVRHRWS